MYYVIILTFVQVGCMGTVNLSQDFTDYRLVLLLLIAAALRFAVDAFIYFILIRAFLFLKRENNASENSL